MYSRRLFAPKSPAIAAMTVGDAIDAMKARGLNTEFIENPLPMFFPYKGGVTGNIAGDRAKDWRNTDVVPMMPEIQNTLDAIAYGYRKHTTRSKGWGKASFAKDKMKALTPDTPIIWEDNGRYVLTQAPPVQSKTPWVDGGATSRIALPNVKVASKPFVDIRDEENLKRWARMEGWDEEWARRYFKANMDDMQVGIPFKVVDDITTSPWNIKQGQVIATPVSRPIVLNSQPNPTPAMTPIEADFWKQIGEFNPDLDAPFIPRVDVNNQPVQNWTLPQSRRMASDVLEPRGEVLPQVASGLGQQYLAMQDSLADLAYAAQSQYGLTNMASSYYP